MNALRRKLIAGIQFTCMVFILWSNSSYTTIGMNVGFYCNDTTIQKPFSGDSISIYLLFSVLLVCAPVVVCLSNCLSKNSMDRARNLNGPSLQHLKYFYSGFLYVTTVTEFLKFIVTELRPHFIASCQPDIGQMKCSDGLITNFNCTGSGGKWLVHRDIYKSFPSGHAALSFYTFVFFSILIFGLLKGVETTAVLIWKICVPLLLLIWSILCCVSRILDNRHFWWDVLFGILLGLISGVIMGMLSVYRGKIKSKKEG